MQFLYVIAGGIYSDRRVLQLQVRMELVTTYISLYSTKLL
jgi:hypothetical protein